MLVRSFLIGAVAAALMVTESAAQLLPVASNDGPRADAFSMMESAGSERVWWDANGVPTPFGPDLLFADSFEGKDCTIAAWDGAISLSDANTGVQDGSNIRFSGPCGLGMVVGGGDPAYLVKSLSLESSLRIRFYVFFDGVSGQVAVLSGLQFSDPQFDVVYNFPTPGDLTLAVASGASFIDLTVPDIGPGWHGVEVEWETGVSAPIALRVNGIEDTATVDTTKIAIDEIQFGVPFSEDLASGIVHLDAFEARRFTPPDLLLKGDSNEDGLINVKDLVSVIREVDLGEFDFGQPDCNADGSIDNIDYQCLLDIISIQ
jgi:hypothetical protein